MKRLSFTLILFLCILSSGCVYFNTFYNAKRRFQEAEKNRQKAEENPNDQTAKRLAEDIYFQAIAKASAVIDLHPNSKWVDDCLLLIGKAEFWREHYLDALRKFAELQSNFPGSGLIEESHLWEGRAHWKMGRYADAQRIFRALAREGRSAFADQAAFALLEIGMEQKDYNLVVDEGKDLLTRLRTNGLKAGVYQKIGEAQMALKGFDGATEAMRNVLKNAPSPRMEYEARSTMGAILETRGEFEKACDLYAEMLKMKRLKKGFEADIRLNLAGALYQISQYDESSRLCKSVIEEFPRTPQSAMAYYQMGLIAQRQRKESTEVKELFKKAQQEDRNAPAYELARQRQDDLDALERYLKQIASDTTGAVGPVFELAELYRLRLNEPDSALVAYRWVVERDTTRDLAPKATYAIGWIYAEAKRDSASARAVFASLVRDYPGTAYAEAAASRLGDGATADDVARTRFQEAESLRLAGADPKTYLPTFERIVSDYPGSLYAVKALYAVAWTYENVLRDVETARKRYQDVAERYAKTALGDLARRKVEAMVVEARTDSLRLIAARADSIREAAARADSLRLAARADSLRLAVRADSIREAAARADSLRLATRAGSLKSLAADSLRSVSRQDSLLEGVRADTPNVPGGAAVSGGADAMQLPQVAQAAPLVYPDSLKEFPTEAQVYLRVLVGKDGRVKEAVVLRGPDRYYQAALATIRQYTFTPGARAGQPEEMWVEQVVEYLPP